MNIWDSVGHRVVKQGSLTSGGGSFKSGQGKYGYESGVPCFARNNGGGACSAGTEVKK